MNITEFILRFPDEQACRIHLKTRREAQGITCKKCGCIHHYWLKNQWMWQCSKCNFRTTLKAGTMFENSNLPIRMWYLAIAFMCFSKKAISACELQRQLRHNRYDTVWSLMHRIRNIMGNRDALFYLQDLLNDNEAHSIIASPDGIKLRRRTGLKDRPGYDKPSQTPIFHHNRSCCHRRYYIKIKGAEETERLKRNTIQSLKYHSVIYNESTEKFVNMEDIIEVFSIEKTGKRKSDSAKWTGITLYNINRILSGIYHKVNLKYLQLYLDEFCYKLNRRFTKEQLFDRMITSCIEHPVLA